MCHHNIHRYELKFMVDARTKGAILRRAESGLAPDPHGEQGVYRVSSQYFDTPELRAYWEKLDGVPFRSKFRLRYYGSAESLERPSFFEIKHRWDQTVYKERIPLLPEALGPLLEDRAALLDLDSRVGDLDPVQGRTLGRILRAAASEFLGGVNIISYLREAWVGRVDPRLRLTFDHLCKVYPPGDGLSPQHELGSPLLPQHQIVMELKFNERLPRWIRDCLVGERLRPIRFSKYAEGLQAHGQLDQRRSVGALQRIRYTP